MCIKVDLPDPDGPMIAAKRPPGKLDGDVAQGIDRHLALAVAATEIAGFDNVWRARTGVSRARAGVGDTHVCESSGESPRTGDPTLPRPEPLLCRDPSPLLCRTRPPTLPATDRGGGNARPGL